MISLLSALVKMLIHNFLEVLYLNLSLLLPLFFLSLVAMHNQFPGITEVEERAVEEAVMHAGAKEVYLIEEPMAAAIGAGIDVAAPSGSIIVDH